MTLAALHFPRNLIQEDPVFTDQKVSKTIRSLAKTCETLARHHKGPCKMNFIGWAYTLEFTIRDTNYRTVSIIKSVIQDFLPHNPACINYYKAEIGTGVLITISN